MYITWFKNEDANTILSVCNDKEYLRVCVWGCVGVGVCVVVVCVCDH